MTQKTLTPKEAQDALGQAANVLRDAGIPAELVRATSHEDTRNGELHQTYLHIEAWAPGAGLARELAAIAARKAAGAATEEA